MASVRKTANCIGVSGDFSIVHDFFGYAAVPKTLSLLSQVRLVKGKHIAINVIRVGLELFSFNDERILDLGVQTAREIFAPAALGIGRVEHYGISLDDADGHEDIDSDCEATALTDAWTVPNHAIDVFIVRVYTPSGIGISPTDGPCDKDAKGPTGVIIAIDETRNFNGMDLTGKTLAHEVSHYLGLDDSNDDDSNLMSASTNGVAITTSQGKTIRCHCFVDQGC